MMCLQCGADIDAGVAMCPDCGQSPYEPPGGLRAPNAPVAEVARTNAEDEGGQAASAPLVQRGRHHPMSWGIGVSPTAQT